MILCAKISNVQRGNGKDMSVWFIFIFVVSIVFIFLWAHLSLPCVKGLLDRDWTVTRQRHECVITRNHPPRGGQGPPCKKKILHRMGTSWNVALLHVCPQNMCATARAGARALTVHDCSRLFTNSWEVLAKVFHEVGVHGVEFLKK